MVNSKYTHTAVYLARIERV